ncbi:hypothetical protein CLOM_g17749 [Closterium sp. NIES-68]|nr:hypothetical protein CLOM_g17749 [Closterium sp. NIES-68]GJP62043.1 hypothetical protein CLOP_g19147 [Closterium sp. NIES-67]
MAASHPTAPVPPPDLTSPPSAAQLTNPFPPAYLTNPSIPAAAGSRNRRHSWDAADPTNQHRPPLPQQAESAAQGARAAAQGGKGEGGTARAAGSAGSGGPAGAVAEAAERGGRRRRFGSWDLTVMTAVAAAAAAGSYAADQSPVAARHVAASERTAAPPEVDMTRGEFKSRSRPPSAPASPGHVAASGGAAAAAAAAAPPIAASAAAASTGGGEDGSARGLVAPPNSRRLIPSRLMSSAKQVVGGLALQTRDCAPEQLINRLPRDPSPPSSLAARPAARVAASSGAAGSPARGLPPPPPPLPPPPPPLPPAPLFKRRRPPSLDLDRLGISSGAGAAAQAGAGTVVPASVGPTAAQACHLAANVRVTTEGVAYNAPSTNVASSNVAPTNVTTSNVAPSNVDDQSTWSSPGVPLSPLDTRERPSSQRVSSPTDYCDSPAARGAPTNDGNDGKDGNDYDDTCQSMSDVSLGDDTSSTIASRGNSPGASDLPLTNRGSNAPGAYHFESPPSRASIGAPSSTSTASHASSDRRASRGGEGLVAAISSRPASAASRDSRYAGQRRADRGGYGGGSDASSYGKGRSGGGSRCDQESAAKLLDLRALLCPHFRFCPSCGYQLMEKPTVERATVERSLQAHALREHPPLHERELANPPPPPPPPLPQQQQRMSLQQHWKQQQRQHDLRYKNSPPQVQSQVSGDAARRLVRAGAEKTKSDRIRSDQEGEGEDDDAGKMALVVTVVGADGRRRRAVLEILGQGEVVLKSDGGEEKVEEAGQVDVPRKEKQVAGDGERREGRRGEGGRGEGGRGEKEKRRDGGEQGGGRGAWKQSPHEALKEMRGSRLERLRDFEAPVGELEGRGGSPSLQKGRLGNTNLKGGVRRTGSMDLNIYTLTTPRRKVDMDYEDYSDKDGADGYDGVGWEERGTERDEKAEREEEGEGEGRFESQAWVTFGEAAEGGAERAVERGGEFGATREQGVAVIVCEGGEDSDAYVCEKVQPINVKGEARRQGIPQVNLQVNIQVPGDSPDADAALTGSSHNPASTTSTRSTSSGSGNIRTSISSTSSTSTNTSTTRSTTSSSTTTANTTTSTTNAAKPTHPPHYHESPKPLPLPPPPTLHRPSPTPLSHLDAPQNAPGNSPQNAPQNALRPAPSPSTQLEAPRGDAFRPAPSPRTHRRISSWAEGGGAGPTAYVLRRPYRELALVYEVGEEELGVGQFGVIRLCVSRATGLLLACKTISKQRIESAEDAEDVRKEVSMLQQVKGHPSIIEIEEAVEDSRHIHIVMELAKGGDLFDRIKQRWSREKARWGDVGKAWGRDRGAERRVGFSEGEAAVVMVRVVEALLYCHSQGIVHRDVKPENILVMDREDDTCVKLIDFGVAARFQNGSPLTEFVGTPYYIAPEVLAGSYGPEADIWSAGVVLYTLLCGAPPFFADTNEEIFDAIKGNPVKFKSARWKKVGSGAKDLLKGMLEKDPEKRLSAVDVLGHPWILTHSRQHLQL